MNQQEFQSLMTMAKSMQSTDPEKSDYWVGFQRGLRRLYHGKNFGTAAEHEKWMNCADGEYRQQLQDGYRIGYNQGKKSHE